MSNAQTFIQDFVVSQWICGRIAGNASAVLGFRQFGVSDAGGLVVGALQNAPATPTSVPMAASIAVCAALALGVNLLAHPAATKPSDEKEAEASVTAAEL